MKASILARIYSWAKVKTNPQARTAGQSPVWEDIESVVKLKHQIRAQIIISSEPRQAVCILAWTQFAQKLRPYNIIES